MPTTRYGNQYTFQITGNYAAYGAVLPGIAKSSIEVIEYLSRYVDWQGVLDFAVDFTGPGYLGYTQGTAISYTNSYWDGEKFVPLLEQPGIPAVYRFYNPAAGTHFYTASATERDTVMEGGGLAYEGIAYDAYSSWGFMRRPSPGPAGRS